MSRGYAYCTRVLNETAVTMCKLTTRILCQEKIIFGKFNSCRFSLACLCIFRELIVSKPFLHTIVNKFIQQNSVFSLLQEAVSLSISKQHDLTVKDKEEIHEVAKLILVSSPGHETDYYARIVLKKLLEKQKQELEDTLHVTQFLPSFLENSVESQR